LQNIDLQSVYYRVVYLEICASFVTKLLSNNDIYALYRTRVAVVAIETTLT